MKQLDTENPVRGELASVQVLVDNDHRVWVGMEGNIVGRAVAFSAFKEFLRDFTKLQYSSDVADAIVDATHPMDSVIAAENALYLEELSNELEAKKHENDV